MIVLFEGYDAELVSQANRTCRSGGASAMRDGKPSSLVMNYVLNNRQEFKEKSILDFGAGKNAVQAEYLRKQGFDVTAYDFGSNASTSVDANALSRKYDVIMMSNVLNVQGSLEMLEATLDDVLRACKPSTTIVCNYPASPRYLVDDEGKKVSPRQLSAILEDVFGRKPEMVGSSSSAPLWKI